MSNRIEIRGTFSSDGVVDTVCARAADWRSIALAWGAGGMCRGRFCTLILWTAALASNCSSCRES